MKNILIEQATTDNAEAILNVHYDAVHKTASKYYPIEILENWSSAIDVSRLIKIKNAIEGYKEIMVVAKIEGTIVGFGSIVP
ncbi:hypothetical protein ACFPYJ_10610 [Paenibacillus solisilvae]|uniref:GNAT family N-acetyltransferase n=1 Tax=Paenibacillus solisilvae TaxID=2486751 RepID=A0ABW0VZL4_9BACL